MTIYQVDERVAPDGDDDRNLTHLLRSLPPEGAADVRRDARRGARPRAGRGRVRRLAPGAPSTSCISGIGPDGHTASLVPGDPVLDVTDRDVAVTGAYQGRKRMTLTYPPLDRARQVLWLVTGDGQGGRPGAAPGG